MTALFTRLQTRMASDEGATAVEYGIMVSLIALAIIGTVFLLGGALDGVFADVLAGIS